MFVLRRRLALRMSSFSCSLRGCTFAASQLAWLVVGGSQGRFGLEAEASMGRPTRGGSQPSWFHHGTSLIIQGLIESVCWNMGMVSSSFSWLVHD